MQWTRHEVWLVQSLLGRRKRVFKVTARKLDDSYEKMTFYKSSLYDVSCLMESLICAVGKSKLSFEIEQMEEDEIDGMD